MQHQTGAPLLTIGLLVSNRRDTIQKCLDSLAVIREAIPCELVITDTGCDAELHHLLECYADQINCFVWCKDFSKARNANLAMATGEWYMYLDDDEWFIDAEEIIEFFRSGDYRNYGYASYIQRNYVDLQGVQYSDTWVSRMIKREADTHFCSRIHEYLWPVNGNCKGLRSIVDHYGYVFTTEEAKRMHYERNRVLLEEMIREEPQELRWRIQLALEYRLMEEYHKLYELGDECLTLSKDRIVLQDRIMLGSFYAAKILAAKELGNEKEAWETCLVAEADARNTELCRAFLSLEKADLAFRLGSYEQAEESGRKYLKWKDFFDKNEPVFFLQEGTAFIGESFDEIMVKRAYSVLIAAGLKRRRTDNLRKLLPELEWVKPFVYLYDGMMETMLWAALHMEPDAALQKAMESIFFHPVLREAFCKEVLSYISLTGEMRMHAEPAQRAGDDIGLSSLWQMIRNLGGGSYYQTSLEHIHNYYRSTIIEHYPELLPVGEQVLLLAKGD